MPASKTSSGLWRVDPVSDGMFIIEEFHARIHEGTAFSASLVDTALGGSANLDMLIRVVSGAAHLQLGGSAGAAWHFFLYEAPTTSADGSAIAVRNRNRFSVNVATTLAFSGPTVTGVGTLLAEAVLPGGVKGQTTGSAGRGFDEWIFSPADYLVRLTNLSGGGTPASININFYEPS